MTTLIQITVFAIAFVVTDEILKRRSKKKKWENRNLDRTFKFIACL